jgi:hypothetical protein
MESKPILKKNCNYRGTAWAEGFQSRSMSCMVQEGTHELLKAAAGPEQPCNASQVNFMNKSLPLYLFLAEGERPPERLNLKDNSASAGGLISFTKIADVGKKLSCAQVRAAIK